MDKEKEKQTIYDRLVELTGGAEPNTYFSKGAILEYIRDYIESQIGAFVGPRKVLKLGEKDFEEIELDETLPRQKVMRPLLEELVKDGKVQKAIINYMGDGYRAESLPQSL